MQAELGKWGNSLAIRIPSHMAKALALESASSVQLSIENGRIIMTPAAPKPTLDSLLASVAASGGREEELMVDSERGNESGEW